MLKIRLRRMGNRNRPLYRVVVSDSRRVPRSSALEELGHYDPTSASGGVHLDVERIGHWLSRGAQMSPTVRKLFRQAQGIAVETGEGAPVEIEPEEATAPEQARAAAPAEAAEPEQAVEAADPAESPS